MSYSTIKSRMKEIESTLPLPKTAFPKTRRRVSEFRKGFRRVITDPVTIGGISASVLVAAATVTVLRRVVRGL